jgi:hypothetical protein
MPQSLSELLQGLPAPASGASEQSFCQAWREHVHQAEFNPFAQALRGGYLADRLAWVFIAGYQAALRQSFSQLKLLDITALAVSEDRSETDPLPGVVWQPRNGQVVLHGYKTWVAAIEQVQQLIVKARGPEPGQSTYFLVPVELPGVVPHVYPHSSRLPDLSQGRMFFDELVLPQTSRLDAAAGAGFGLLEALMIYSAFLGMVWRRTQAGSAEQNQAMTLLGQLQKMLAAPQSGGDLSALDEGVQRLREQLANGLWAQDEGFLRDQNLISMYSRGLRNH